MNVSEQKSAPLFVQPKKPMLRLFAYMSPFWRRLSFACTSSVGNKVLDLMPPILVAWVIDSLQGSPPAWIETLTDTQDPYRMAVFLALLTVAIFFLESLFQWMYQYGFLTLAQNVQHHLRLDAYDRLQSREIAFFEEHRTGESLAMLNDDVNQLERFLNDGFNDILQLVTLFAFAGSVLFATSWQLALVGLSPVPLIVAGSFLYQKAIAPRYSRVRRAVGALSARLENNISGILVIKSFTAEAYESGRLRETSDEYRDANFQAIKFSALYVPVIRTGIAAGFAGVLLLGSYWILGGSGILSVGELVLFSMMVQRLLWPMTRMGKTLDEFERARASARRVFGLLDTEATIRDPEHPKEPGAVRGEVEMEDVSFTYRRGVPVLKGVSFHIRPGERIGVAGPTGSGKTTMIKLLLRLYDVTGGAIRIDGLDIRDLRLARLRENIALVSQDAYMFHGTVRENIAYARDDIALDDVIHAARLARLHEFVAGLPEGYDTFVGERGIKLSGGQRQRLSIARAILKDAPILILDEATSSVDTETERAIQENMNTLTSGRTALIIAHRLSTIRHADRILVVRDGLLVEEGRHEELLATGGVYADLWNVQAGEGPPSVANDGVP